MALKTTNKNRKKEDGKTRVELYIDSLPEKEEKGASHSWWWVPHNPKPYFIGFGVLVLVLLFL